MIRLQELKNVTRHPRPWGRQRPSYEGRFQSQQEPGLRRSIKRCRMTGLRRPSAGGIGQKGADVEVSQYGDADSTIPLARSGTGSKGASTVLHEPPYGHSALPSRWDGRSGLSAPYTRCKKRCSPYPSSLSASTVWWNHCVIFRCPGSSGFALCLRERRGTARAGLGCVS